MALLLLEHSAASGQYDHRVNREINPKYDWFRRPKENDLSFSAKSQLVHFEPMCDSLPIQLDEVTIVK